MSKSSNVSNINQVQKNILDESLYIKQNKREFCAVKIQHNWQWDTHLLSGDFMETVNIIIFKAISIDYTIVYVDIHTVFLRCNTNTYTYTVL